MTTVTDDSDTAAPPPAPPPPRRLTRSTHDRIVAGVCGGAGRYFGVDPVVFRIGFVVACFVGGAGLFGYAAGWLLVPEADDGGAPSDRRPDIRQRDLLFWVGIGLLVMAGFALADEFGFWTTGWLTPLLLIGVGFALWRSGTGEREQPETSPDDVRDDVRDDTAATAREWPAADDGPAPAPAEAAVTAPVAEERRTRPRHRRRRRRRRERSALGRLTVGVLLVVSGVAAALDAADLVDLTVGEVLTIDLAIVGLGLAIGAWYGRSRGLILLGLVLTPLMLFANVVGDLPWAPEGGAGERTVVVTDLAHLEDTYELGAGELLVDLSRLELDGATVAIEVRLGTGEARVLLPPGAGYHAAASVRIGQVDLPGGSRDQGFGATGTATAEGDGTIHLDVTVGVGRAHVTTATAQEG